MPILRTTLLLLLAGATSVWATDLPPDYFDEEQSQALIDKTLRLRLDPSLDHLSAGEKTAVEKLLAVGHIFQQLYEVSCHHQAYEAHRALGLLDSKLGSPVATQNLLDIYRFSKGPIVTTLENERVPFLPVSPEVPGRNVYPVGVTKEEMEAFFADHPDQREAILHLRHVVRVTDGDNLRRDLQVLHRYPTLDVLHPGLKDRLEDLAHAEAPPRYYAVPYSVAYAEELLDAFGLLHEAADAVGVDDPAFARYLRNRARDLLTDDYEAGDASWVTGRFGNLNAEIGAYETYDDKLYSTKSFFALSLLARDRARSEELRDAIGGIQEIENSLPYEAHKTVRSDIPVGVYDVIADFGQARGTNTASILPNEAYLARQYGRTILLRTNIMTHPELFALTRASYEAAVHPDHHQDLRLEGNFYRTLWHEIGHYLGVDTTADGRDLDSALEETSNTLEEMKADLVSLFSAKFLHEAGHFTDAQLRAVYASGIRRVLQNNRPRPTQPYQTMQLMQWNYFLENGLLEFDPEAEVLRIHHDRYHDVVTALLADVLRLQRDGDQKAALAFIARLTAWDEDLHGVIAANLRGAVDYRYRLVKYAALGE